MDQGKSGGPCSNSGTLNWHFEGLIHWREPEGFGDEIVFWIDCSICGEWAHNRVHLERIALHVSMYALIVENHKRSSIEVFSFYFFYF